MKLSDRWRPRRFSDLIGQKNSVEWCLKKLSEGPESAILYGPTGCGKTSEARIYAQACACERPHPDGTACENCNACAHKINGDRNEFYTEINCATLSLPALLGYLDLLKIPPYVGRRRILVLDEAHGLTKRQSTALLKALEAPHADFVILLLTDQLENIKRPVRSRLSKQEVVEPSAEDLLKLAVRVCDAEHIEFEEAALRQLVHHCQGSIRELLQFIDDLSVGGRRLTGEVVKSCFQSNAETAVGLLRDLLERNLAGASALIGGVPRDVKSIVGAVDRLLVVLEYRARGLLIDDDALGTVSPVQLDDLAAKARVLSDLRNVKATQIWAELSALWRRSPIASVHELRSVFLDCDHWIDRQASLRRNANSKRRKGSHARSRPHVRAKSADNHLSLKQAVRLWDSASFMAQAHGVYFNSRLVLRPPLLGITGLSCGQRFVAEVLRNLVSRVRDWTQSSVHWAYVATGSAQEPLFVAALWIPTEFQAEVERWLFDYIETRVEVCPPEAFTFRCTDADELQDRISFHARQLRMLCRTVNPAIMVRTKAGRKPLIDEMGVPRRIRSANSLIVPRLSKTIGRTASKDWKRRGLSLRTPGRDGAWNDLNLGWEASQYQENLAEIKRLAAMRDRLPLARIATNEIAANDLLAGNFGPINARKLHSRT